MPICDSRLCDTLLSFPSDGLLATKLLTCSCLLYTSEIRKTLEPCHSKMYLFAYNDLVNEGGELPGVLITGSSNLSYQGLKGRLELNARFNDKQDYDEGKRLFDELWETSVVIVSKDILDDWNNKVMTRIWYDKIYSPYLMYIRVLKEYFNIPTSNKMCIRDSHKAAQRDL